MVRLIGIMKYELTNKGTFQFHDGTIDSIYTRYAQSKKTGVSIPRWYD
jgi:hypothetical protein